MTLSPYHVRLAISQYGGQFRAELFTEDLGDTNGDLLPVPWELLDEEFQAYLAAGAAGLPPEMARKVGQEMFSYMLGQGENSKKWTEILAQADRQNRPVRLLVDATTEEVRDLPYGLLCDPDDDFYLARSNPRRASVRLVRILRRCTPRLLNLKKPRLKLLLAAAEPKRLPQFDCAAQLRELAASLPLLYDVYLCGDEGAVPLLEAIPEPLENWRDEHFEPFRLTTREGLRKSLRLPDLDLLHLLAHGCRSGVALCGDRQKREEATASELGGSH